MMPAGVIGEAVTALRNSPAGYLESLRTGHRNVEEFAAWLEEHESEAIVQNIAERLPGRLAESERRQACHAEIGRHVVAALEAYRKLEGGA